MFRRGLMLAMTMLLTAGIWGSALALTEEEMLAINEASTAAFNAHDMEQWSSYFTDDAIFDYVPFPPPTEGKEAIAAFVGSFFQVFPDLQSTSERILTSGNILVEEHMISGTLQGEFLGIPPTGKGGDVMHLSIDEFEGNKIKRQTTYLDYVTVMVNIGAMPAGALPPLEPSVEIPDPEATGLSPSEAAQEFISRFNTHDLSHHVKMVHTDAEILFMPIGVPMDRNGYVALLELYLLGFPDLVGDVMRVIELGDGWVVIETVFSGTHDGPYMGVPATGLPSQTRTAGVMRFDAEGLLTNEHFYFDSMKALMDIGAVPGPTTVLPTTWGQVKSLFQE